MHEVGIMEGALESARQLMTEHGGSRLLSLSMTIGSLSGVEPTALQNAFTALKDAYCAADAELKVTWIDAVCHCDTCHKDFSFSDHGFICPLCAEPALSILNGRELELTRLEWE